MKVKIRNGIAALRRIPCGSEQVDEGLCGMEADVLEQTPDYEWLRIRMFYGYEGWIRQENVEPVRGVEKRMTVGSMFTDVRCSPEVRADTIECFPRGACLEITGEEGRWKKVRLPDGRCGFVPEEALLPEWQESGRKFGKMSEKQQREKLVRTAMGYLGAPYRWGGKTPEGIDCSGLTQMTYLLNGVIIYRDAELKPGYPVHEIPVNAKRPGDLLYFPGHIALYLGENRYIHATAAAGAFCVTVNSFSPSDPEYREDLAGKILMAGSIF